ncbi:MAG: T9SS type A sorting domain-containing protein, partial [Fimbriimonadaceae bacterium]|nr:T9SS type A sorting domain-containing protein [Chitinophagales bacterium]
AKFFVVRFNADGIIDETFGINGVAKTPVFDDNAYSGKIVLLPDDKILIGCAAKSPGGSEERLAFIRFTPNGIMDSTLSGDGIIYPSFDSPFNYHPRDFIVQPDGKIIVAGTRYSVAFFARFNTDYKIDSTFGHDGIFNGDYSYLLDTVNFLQALSLLEDGKILAIGITFCCLSRNVGIFRLNPDGSFDETFSSNGYFEIAYSSGNDIASNIIVQPDGKYIISAIYHPIVAYDMRWMLIRLNADGTLDESFGSGGIKTLGFKDISGLGDGGGYEIFSGLAIAPDGNLMAALSDFDDYTKRDIALSKFILNDIPCENAPTGLFATNTTTNKSKLHWSADPDAIKYKLQYRPYASLIWVSLNAPNNLKILTGLAANTTYEYRVRSLCSTGLLSPWSSIEEFTTLPLRENEIISEGKIEISIYPNPNSGAFILQISELIEEEIIYINIKNMLGEEIYSEHINTSQSTHQINLNKNITSGIYLVELKTDDKIYSQQIIISN